MILKWKNQTSLDNINFSAIKVNKAFCFKNKLNSAHNALNKCLRQNFGKKMAFYVKKHVFVQSLLNNMVEAILDEMSCIHNSKTTTLASKAC